LNFSEYLIKEDSDIEDTEYKAPVIEEMEDLGFDIANSYYEPVKYGNATCIDYDAIEKDINDQLKQSNIQFKKRSRCDTEVNLESILCNN